MERHRSKSRGNERRHSPYNYGFNNPIRFVDPDGMKPEWIVGTDGKRVSYSTGANGKTTWSANVSSSVKTYGNALLAVGSKGSLDKVINNDIKAKIIISSGIKQETQSDGKVKTTFGETIQGNKNAADSYGAKVNDDGTYGIKEATITIFNGSIEKGVKAGSGSKLEGLT